MTTPNLEELLTAEGPTCLVIHSWLEPVAGLSRFQPAGFPEVGHVLYDAPHAKNELQRVCIIDSPASMANHLEAVCLAGLHDTTLHADLAGLPFVICVTDRQFRQENGTITLDSRDPHDKVVVTTLTEGHRLASDYFLDGLLNAQWTEGAKATPRRGGKAQDRSASAHWEGTRFREQLRREFGLVEVQRDKTYFLHPEDWWAIYKTIFKYDPNSLVHGVMFAREQLRMSRLLTAHLEAFGAARVGRSGVKFDRLGKTVSGQPIFDVDEETAHEIRATFILDLALLRSYGRGPHGLAEAQKRLLLELSLWKIQRLLGQPFRYRTGCHLRCSRIELSTEKGVIGEPLPSPDLQRCIRDCGLDPDPVTQVYYPASDLFKVRQDEDATIPERADDEDGGLGAED